MPPPALKPFPRPHRSPERSVRIGHYVLGRTLRELEFGLGKVMLASHEITGHQIAVKVLRKSRIARNDMADQVTLSLKILKLLTHPHVARVYEVIETVSEYFVISEYVGHTLSNYWRQSGPLPEAEARLLFRQIISALEHVHYFGVVHGRLNPANLLLRRPKPDIPGELQAKIADFGFLRLSLRSDNTKTQWEGPDPWLAPELLNAQPLTSRSDMWCAGVLLLTLLLGREPWQHVETIPQLVREVQAFNADALPLPISPGCRAVLNGLLQVDPGKRIGIADLRKTSWFQEDMPASFPTPPTGEGKVIDQQVLQQVARRFALPFDIALKALYLPTKNDVSVLYYTLLSQTTAVEDPPPGSGPLAANPPPPDGVTFQRRQSMPRRRSSLRLTPANVRPLVFPSVLSPCPSPKAKATLSPFPPPRLGLLIPSPRHNDSFNNCLTEAKLLEVLEVSDSKGPEQGPEEQENEAEKTE